MWHDTPIRGEGRSVKITGKNGEMAMSCAMAIRAMASAACCTAWVFCTAAADGVIAIPDSATPVERSAAAELQEAVARMSGRTFPIVAESEACADTIFFIGATRMASAATNEAGVAEWKYDEVFVKSVPGGIVLAGHPVRGPLYAVDVWLEDFCGVRWWTSTESHYPRLANLPVSGCRKRHAPTFRFRETYYLDGFNAAFKVRSKGNFSSPTRYMLTPMEFIPPEKGGDHRIFFFKGRRSAYHSFFEILPPARHFKDHPEWYSEIDGKRKAKQLCLTNPGMEAAFVAETVRLLREDPSADFISVSQNDWNGPCGCAACRAVIDEEGAVSGLYLRFVNRVAEALERESPHVTVDTFAYQFTRKPPRKTRPRHNVIVRLCDIECAFNAPLADSHLADDFVANLKDWGRIAAGRLFIWDYVTDFTSYMMPHPNVGSLAPNIRLFAEAGAVGVFEQGDALCAAGSFAALSHWMIAHLLWDASRDGMALRNEFIAGYYGKSAAPHVMACRDIVDGAGAQAAARGKKIGCYHQNVKDFMDRQTALAAAGRLDAAIAAAENDGEDFVRRLRRERLSFDHMKIVNWKEWKMPGSRAAAIRRWIGECREFGVIAYKETTARNTFDDYCGKLLRMKD